MKLGANEHRMRGHCCKVFLLEVKAQGHGELQKILRVTRYFRVLGEEISMERDTNFHRVSGNC